MMNAKDKRRYAMCSFHTLSVRRGSPRRVPLLQGHRVTPKGAWRGRAGLEVRAASIAMGDWADPRTHRAVALRGILSFAKGYSMFSKSMAPLFAGLG